MLQLLRRLRLGEEKEEEQKLLEIQKSAVKGPCQRTHYNNVISQYLGTLCQH